VAPAVVSSMKTAKLTLSLFCDARCAAAHDACASNPASARPQVPPPSAYARPTLQKESHENYLCPLDYTRPRPVGSAQLGRPDQLRQYLDLAAGGSRPALNGLQQPYAQHRLRPGKPSRSTHSAGALWVAWSRRAGQTTGWFGLSVVLPVVGA